jgi:UDPglucose--hexose-1-phosphate uridylyltransferase
MSELRWNPFIKDWVIIAPKRQNRPELSKGGCPFCPGSGKVPENYEVFSFTNDYPSLSPNLSPAAGQEDEILRNREAYGRCEVILYSPDHDKSLWQLPVEHIEKLVDLWGQRFTALKKDKMIKYIYVFETEAKQWVPQYPTSRTDLRIFLYSKKLELKQGLPGVLQRQQFMSHVQHTEK